MSFSIQIKASAAKSLSRIPKAERSRLIQAIDRLRQEPLAGGTLKGEFSGLRRLRVGEYRIVYEVLHEQVTVLVVRIGHRREVYR
ncbi:MAG TPA: type II toxin-antitoxin system RelE/ParE family toxin [Thermoanaerobaculia bacterium]|nr:type II toxin-antitoxin system RelE/ParE family toxin [Thermoanaerobaculia bacterium]